MTMLVFALLVVALALLLEWWLCRYGLRAVQEEFCPEQSVVEPGETVWLRVRLKNTGRLLLPYLRASLVFPPGIIPCDEGHARQDVDRQFVAVSYSVWLKPRQERDLRIPVRIPRRGRYILPRLTVKGGDFLGVAEPLRELNRFNEVVVAPAPAPEPPVQLRLGGLLGDLSVNRFLFEDPILTAGCREYTGREPMRQISWAQSARGRGLMVKQPDYTTEPVVTVLVNVAVRSTGLGGQVEECFSLARTVCAVLERRMIPYSLALNSVLEYGRTNHMAYAGGQNPAKLKQGLGETHFRRALELLGRATSRVDLPGEPFLLRAAGEGGVHCRILITTRDGMPPAGAVAQLRAASGGELLVITPQEEATE